VPTTPLILFVTSTGVEAVTMAVDEGVLGIAMGLLDTSPAPGVRETVVWLLSRLTPSQLEWRLAQRFSGVGQLRGCDRALGVRVMYGIYSGV